MRLKPLFHSHASALPPVTPGEIGRYDDYFSLLCEWNEKINLVSRRSIETSFAFHFADSLFLAEFAHRHLGGRDYRDLGTGAGFPGMVFAIRYPSIAVTLYEKLAKRRLFLAAVIEKLRLENVSLEGITPMRRFRGLFTARAVLPPADLFPFMEKHLSTQGRFVLSLGGSTTPPAIPKAFLCVSAEDYELPESAGFRKQILFERRST